MDCRPAEVAQGLFVQLGPGLALNVSIALQRLLSIQANICSVRSCSLARYTSRTA